MGDCLAEAFPVRVCQPLRPLRFGGQLRTAGIPRCRALQDQRHHRFRRVWLLQPPVDGIVQPHDLRRGRVGGAAGLFMVPELTDDPVYRRIHVHDRGIPAAFASQIQLAAVLPAAAQPGHLPAAGAAEVWSQPRNGRLLSVGLLPGILFRRLFLRRLENIRFHQYGVSLLIFR